MTFKNILTGIGVFLVYAVIAFSNPAYAADATTHPDATNTGTTGTLTPDSGNVTLGTGQTLENISLTGCVVVNGSNVTIRNVKVACTGGNAAINVTSGNTILIENSEITMPAGQGVGIYTSTATNVTIRAVEISQAGDLIMINNTNGVIIRDSWLHDPQMGGHVDVIQVVGGKNILIQNNTFKMSTGTGSGGSNFTANVIVKADIGPIDTVTIDNNFGQGGSAPFYCMAGNDPQNSNSSGQFPAPTNCHITNNTILAGSFTYTVPLIVNQAAGELINCNKLSDGSLAKVARNDRGGGIFTNTCTGGVTPTVSPSPSLSPFPSPTIGQPTGDPTASPSATITPGTGCSKKAQGDSDCSGVVSITDFAIWRAEFINGCSKTNLTFEACGQDVDGNGSSVDADYNADGNPGIADFAIWRTAFLAR